MRPESEVGEPLNVLHITSFTCSSLKELSIWTTTPSGLTEQVTIDGEEVDLRAEDTPRH